MPDTEKHQFKQVAAFAASVFSCPLDWVSYLEVWLTIEGTCFMPFSALVGGGIYRVYVEKNNEQGAILVVALVIGAFSLLPSWAGAFLPALVGGLLAELVAGRGHYQSKLGNALSFLLFSFTTTGPILMMWIQPSSYRASLLSIGKSMDYIERVMVTVEYRTVSWFLLTLLLGALLGYLLGSLVYQKR